MPRPLVMVVLAVLLASLSVLAACSIDEASYANVQLINESGFPYGVQNVNGKIRTSSVPYLYDIAEGNIPGHEAWSKTGYNGDVGTTEEDMWPVGGSYVFPAAAIQMEVVSSSANDDAAGTGIQSVRIDYLDNNYLEAFEVVDMSGLVANTTVAVNILRVNGFRAQTAGTGAKAAGNITLRTAGGGTTYSYIPAGYTRARNVQYTVPADKSLYVTSIAFSAAATKDVMFTTRANYNNLTGVTQLSFFLPYSEVVLDNQAYAKELELPTVLPPKTDIKVSVIAFGTGGAIASCSLRGWLERN
jgi:hypothetical protein